MGNVTKVSRRSRWLVVGRSAVYHVVSRIAFRRMVLDGEAKAVFVKMLRKQAEFSGLEVLAYCVMSNHFHLLVRVPEPCEVEDRELMRRYRRMYGENCPASVPVPDVMEAILEAGGASADEWRRRLIARMHQLSPFVAELKQRFSIWYNHHRGNQGTVWSERFRSIIVEDSPEFTAPVAAYIDLNPVRAQMVEDPGDYGFSSYGAAMRGDRIAQKGLDDLFHRTRSWGEAIRSYRILLFGKGTEAKGLEHKDLGVIDGDRAEQVIANGGKLSWSEYLRMHVGYFTRGGVLGSSVFVEELAGTLGAAMDKSSETLRGFPLNGVNAEMRALRRLTKGYG